jgi:FtsH-binding integral membrane protein
METVRTLVSAQLLVTAFLAVLLWALHSRLHKAEYNRWWVAAWTTFALFLAVGRLGDHRSRRVGTWFRRALSCWRRSLDSRWLRC